MAILSHRCRHVALLGYALAHLLQLLILGPYFHKRIGTGNIATLKKPSNEQPQSIPSRSNYVFTKSKGNTTDETSITYHGSRKQRKNPTKDTSKTDGSCKSTCRACPVHINYIRRALNEDKQDSTPDGNSSKSLCYP